MRPFPDLTPILEGIPWVIIGAVATREYMPERTTNGLDIIVMQKDFKRTVSRLKKSGYELVSSLLGPGCFLRSPDGTELYLLFGKQSWLRKALQNPLRNDAGYPVMDLPYLTLMKTESARSIDISDVSCMLGLASDAELLRVREVIKKYAPYLSDDIESMAYLGKLELERGLA
ncbi:MAG: hypothetical protein B6244_07500 [Candidatus Cloacimonetes bacterium 4572_55]|nr:MAG: hypothetical protein B6244_07500 [Candidatus Cloacimonetes bacterium 4572_55]